MHRQLDRLEAGYNRVTVWLARLVAASIGLFAVLIPLNLFLLKFQVGNIWWLYEAMEYALYIGVFIGAPWVLQQGAHVRVDVLTTALPDKISLRLERILDAACAALCILLCSYGVRSAISEFRDSTLPDKDLRIETGYMMVVFAVSFVLLAIEFLLRMRRNRSVYATERGGSSGSGF